MKLQASGGAIRPFFYGVEIEHFDSRTAPIW
ncbi:hypothetical protein ABIE33_003410 [Ensifer sp. 4252]